MNNIEIFTKDNCPECVKMKSLLTAQGYTFTEEGINTDNIDYIVCHTRSAPAIFVDGEFFSNKEITELMKTYTAPADLTLTLI